MDLRVDVDTLFADMTIPNEAPTVAEESTQANPNLVQETNGCQKSVT